MTNHMFRDAWRIFRWLKRLAGLAGLIEAGTRYLPVRGWYNLVWPIAHTRCRGNGVALTFDDGPHPVITPMILDVLAQHKTPVTFFLLGKNAERYPDLVRRIVAEGHQVGLHSWSHADMSTMPHPAVEFEIHRNIRTLEAIIPGQWQPLLRPPFGFSNINTYRAAQRFGLKIVYWNVTCMDWMPGIPLEKRLWWLRKRVRPGSIILLHDANFRSVDIEHHQTVQIVEHVCRMLKQRNAVPLTPEGSFKRGT